MTDESRRPFREAAADSRADGEFELAARYYTLGAYRAFASADYPEPEAVTTATSVGIGLYCLQSAAISFRLTGSIDRCRNRCEQGILIASDFRDHVFGYDALRGVAAEAIGDLRMIGELDGSDEGYETALVYYEDVGDAEGWQAETVFEWLLCPFLEVADATDRPVSDEEQHEIRRSLRRRVEHIQAEFPSLLDALGERGEWGR